MHSVTLFLVGIGALGLSPVFLGVVYLIRRGSEARRVGSVDEHHREGAAK